MYIDQGEVIKRLTDGALIPKDPGNGDYLAVLAWVADGNEIAPQPDPEPVPPSRCTRRQGRLALLEVGLLDDVEALIAAIPDDIQRRAAQIEYEADTWERSNATLQAVWAQMGRTPEGLAALFANAVTK